MGMHDGIYVTRQNCQQGQKAKWQPARMDDIMMHASMQVYMVVTDH